MNLNEIQSNLFNTLSDIVPSELFKVNIFGLLGIFLLLSGIGSGYLAYCLLYTSDAADE